MSRDRDRTKVSTTLSSVMHAGLEKWQAEHGLTTAEALRQIVSQVLREEKPGGVAQVPVQGSDASIASRSRVRVIPTPVEGRDRARSPSANTSATALATAGQEPVLVDSRTKEEGEWAEFLQSPVTHALLSAWECSRCGTPVDPKWSRCPVCGDDEMKKRDIGGFPGFDEVEERWRSARELERR